MIKIDIPMPESCEECLFCEDIKTGMGVLIARECSIMPHVPAWINVTKYKNKRSEHCILIEEEKE